MLKRLAFCVFLVSCYSELSARTVNEPVLNLNEGNFDEATKSNRLMIVYFFSPGCGKCIEFAPKYHKAAKDAFIRNDIKFVFAEINGQVERRISEDYGVVRYPAVKIVRDGSPYPYEGTMSADGILEHLAMQSSPNWKAPESNLIILTAANYSDFILERPLCLVTFLASWCGHCKQIHPHVVEAAKILKNHGIPVVKIDEHQKELLTNNSIRAFPHLMITTFNKSRELRLNHRTSDEIVQKVLRFSGPASHIMNSVGELKAHLRKIHVTSEPVFIGVLTKDNIEEEYEYIYMEAARNMSETRHFAHSFNKDVAKFLDCPSIPCFTVSYNQSFLTAQDKKRIAKNIIHGKDNWIYINFFTFVNENYLSSVGYRDSESEDLEEAYGKTAHLLTVYFQPDFTPIFLKETLRIMKIMADIASDYPNITFCVANEEKRKAELKLVGLDMSGEDINVAIWTKSIRNHKYKMMDEFNQKSLRKFVKSYVEGKLKRYIFSQPELSQDINRKDGIPLVAVGTDFEKLIISDKIDVLLLMHLAGNGESEQAIKALDQNTVRKIQKMGIRVVTFELGKNDIPESFIPEKATTLQYLSHDLEMPEKSKLFSEKYKSSNILKFVQDSQTAKTEKKPDFSTKTPAENLDEL